MGKALYQHVIPKMFIQVLYEYLEACGHDPEAVLGEAWPQPNSQEAEGIRVEKWERMLLQAAEHLSDPLICLRVANTATARHMGVLGFVLSASENLGAALLRLQRYLRLIFDVKPMVIREGDGWFEVTWGESEYQISWMIDVMANALLAQFSRSLIRGELNPLLVKFKHKDWVHANAYESFFNCPVLFGQSDVVIRYSTEVLSLPLKSHDPALIDLLQQHADRLLDTLPQQEEVVAQLRKVIVKTLREGEEPQIDRVSAQLGVSTRTLQRRLRLSGTSFRQELNVVRYELAQSYLRDTTLQLADVAMLLGYSEQSAFNRAFKLWSGRTPSEAQADVSRFEEGSVREGE